MFEIYKIVSYLNKYKNQLNQLYKWNYKFDGELEKIFINENKLTELKSNTIPSFQKEEILKEILSKELQNSYQNDIERFEKIALWIIRDWGKINSGSESKTLKLVKDFVEDEKPKFNRIASTSKVGGFMYPEKNIIYDSRVAYTINWILLSQNAAIKYFPIPEGRNSKMNAFNIDVLIHLKHINKYRPSKSSDFEMTKNYISNLDKELYIIKNEAYYEMNNLINEVNKSLWTDKRKKEPFYTEMLLFSLADTVVFKEITETATLKINNK